MFAGGPNSGFSGSLGASLGASTSSAWRPTARVSPAAGSSAAAGAAGSTFTTWVAMPGGYGLRRHARAERRTGARKCTTFLKLIDQATKIEQPPAIPRHRANSEPMTLCCLYAASVVVTLVREAFRVQLEELRLSASTSACPCQHKAQQVNNECIEARVQPHRSSVPDDLVDGVRHRILLCAHSELHRHVAPLVLPQLQPRQHRHIAHEDARKQRGV